MDRGAWQATVHKVAETDMTEATEHSTDLIYWCQQEPELYDTV